MNNSTKVMYLAQVSSEWEVLGTYEYSTISFCVWYGWVPKFYMNRILMYTCSLGHISEWRIYFLSLIRAQDPQRMKIPNQKKKITVVDYWWTLCLRKRKRTRHSHLILLVCSHLHVSQVYNTPDFTWLFYHLSTVRPSCLCRTKERFRESRCTIGGNRTTNEWIFSSTRASNLAFFHSEILVRVRGSLNSNR